MSTPWVLRRVIESRLNGVTPLGLTLGYRLVDPVAIGITLATRYGPTSWCVARDVIRDGLNPDRVPVYAAAATVQLCTPAIKGDSLMTLRSGNGQSVSLIVSSAELADFLALTYRTCSEEREARIVTKELEAQIGFMHLRDPR